MAKASALSLSSQPSARTLDDDVRVDRACGGLLKGDFACGRAKRCSGDDRKAPTALPQALTHKEGSGCCTNRHRRLTNLLLLPASQPVVRRANGRSTTTKPDQVRQREQQEHPPDFLLQAPRPAPLLLVSSAARAAARHAPAPNLPGNPPSSSRKDPLPAGPRTPRRPTTRARRPDHGQQATTNRTNHRPPPPPPTSSFMNERIRCWQAVPTAPCIHRTTL